MITIKAYQRYILTAFLLIAIGLLMIYSASSIWAKYKTGNEFYYVIRQGIFLIVGIVVFIIAFKMNIQLLYKYANIIFLFCLILLIIVLIPGIGIKRGGARSWIGIGDFAIQPSEFMKLGLIIFTSKFLTNNENILAKNRYFYMYLLVIAFVFFLILLEPDFGSGMLMTLSICLILFIGNIQIKNIVIGIILAASLITVMIIMAPYRLARITSFIDPWSDPLGSGFQIIQSLYAIAPSGLFGYGLFNSKQKYFYLPEPQNDFIFSIVVEELGIIGGLVVLFLFFYLIYKGYRLSKVVDNPFKAYLVYGFTSLFFVQVFINISVVIGLIPVTGVTLPFISYGGSSLVISMFMIGVISNIYKNEKTLEDYKEKRRLSPLKLLLKRKK